MRESLQDIVARRRRALGLTQIELSERAGMSQEWASKIERGEIRNPRRDALLRLADALGIPRDEIVVAAGFAPSRKAARAMLVDLSDDDVSRLADLHDRFDAYLVRLDVTDLDGLERYLEIMANAADLRKAQAAPPEPRQSSAETNQHPDEVTES